MTSTSRLRYVVDPNDPRAPSAEVWATLTDTERSAIAAALPSEFPLTAVPEGDPHRLPKESAVQALRDWFRRNGRKVYLSAELPVYYPSEAMFAPDVIAVLDVEPTPRERWLVSAENRGLDFALEIHVHGNAKKDREENVARYARLGIPEYFLYEPLAPRMLGYRLAPGAVSYTPIVPQAGRWNSRVLGLDLAMENNRVRFYSGAAPLPDAEELIIRLDHMVNEAMLNAVADSQALLRDLEQERQRAEQEQQRADDEKRRAERLSARLRELGVDPDDV